MNKKLMTILSVLIIIVFIGYIVFDSVNQGVSESPQALIQEYTETLPDSWEISEELKIEQGELNAVAVSQTGFIYVGGDSFVRCYDQDLSVTWDIETPYPVTCLSVSGDSVFAGTMDLILVISTSGELQNEWGPFEDNSIITSVSSNKSYVVFADAGSKSVFCLDKGGEVKSLIGQRGVPFILPSPYFDAAIDDNNTLYIANTGNRRLETRNIDGEVLSYFGEPGTAPDAFCGCCNPAHLILVPGGFITAEKGLNRIKVLKENGEFVEFVTAHNNFEPSIPLDIASADGKTLYAVNPYDSKLYVYRRKQ